MLCSFQVRYSGDKTRLASAIRAAVKEVAPAVPSVDIRTMNELMGATLGTERLISQLSSFFGLLALSLASIGLYGVMAYNVSSKTNEIGIRVDWAHNPAISCSACCAKRSSWLRSALDWGCRPSLPPSSG